MKMKAQILEPPKPHGETSKDSNNNTETTQQNKEILSRIEHTMAGYNQHTNPKTILFSEYHKAQTPKSSTS